MLKQLINIKEICLYLPLYLEVDLKVIIELLDSVNEKLKQCLMLCSKC